MEKIDYKLKIKIANQIIKITELSPYFQMLKWLTGLIINFGMGHLKN